MRRRFLSGSSLGHTLRIMFIIFVVVRYQRSIQKLTQNLLEARSAAAATIGHQLMLPLGLSQVRPGMVLTTSISNDENISSAATAASVFSLDNNSNNSDNKKNGIIMNHSSPPSSSQQPYMRACLVVRNSNHLLYEWVAYHYTVLPLRHLIVAFDDIANTTTPEQEAEDDPTLVLERWTTSTTTNSNKNNNAAGLRWEVWRASDVARNITYTSQDRFFRHLQRQHVFYAKCMEYLHQLQPTGWVALTDIDEYIQLNPLDRHLIKTFTNESTFRNDSDSAVAETKQWYDEQSSASAFLSRNHSETMWDRVQARKQLRQQLRLDQKENATQDTSSSSSSLLDIPVANQSTLEVPTTKENKNVTVAIIPTVIAFMDAYMSQHGGPDSFSPCFPFARRRYSAVVDNFDNLSTSICVPNLAPEIRNAFNISHLVTIQFLYHVNPGTFAHNKYAKVLVDLRRIPFHSLNKVVIRNNPHDPLDECPGSYIPDAFSIIRANHYINYGNVHVTRRGSGHLGNSTTELQTWDGVAHERNYQSCDHIHAWLNDFVREFGMEKAKYLLGHTLL